MIFALLPRFLTPERPITTPDIRKPHESRLVPLLILVGFLALLGVLIFSVWPAIEYERKLAAEKSAPPAPEPPPLDFKLVKERFVKVRTLTRWEDVELLLGPPTHRRQRGPEFWAVERDIEHFRRPFGLPKDHFWDKWIDPDDDRRWVAVLYSGERRVYGQTSSGIEEDQ
jgi:hypothetical protein